MSNSKKDQAQSAKFLQSETALTEVANRNESDAVSFWLLLLFIATFFAIAAEESRRPSTFRSQATFSNRTTSIAPRAFSVNGEAFAHDELDTNRAAKRRLDLSSSDRNKSFLENPGKLSNPAIGK